MGTARNNAFNIVVNESSNVRTQTEQWRGICLVNNREISIQPTMELSRWRTLTKSTTGMQTQSNAWEI